jgi:hypothetical protein
MAHETSSIDDLLTGVASRSAPVQQSPEPAEEITESVPHETFSVPPLESSEPEVEAEANDYGDVERPVQKTQDDYGNEVAPPRVFTEDEVNERINAAVRERFSRLERNQQGSQQQQQVQQQTQKGFEYNSESPESWQQQLESFVEQTYYKINQKQAYQSQQAQEQRAYEEHGEKFRQGASKFADFERVVASQPITDAMTLATRAMKDPAAFLYAAAKRAPQELERISRIGDQYVQIAEMAKLEERMKQSKPTSKAPRPVSRTRDDVPIAHSAEKKQPTIEELIAKDANRRLELQKKRR